MKHDAINGGYCSCGGFHYPDHLYIPRNSCEYCGLGEGVHPKTLTSTHVIELQARNFGKSNPTNLININKTNVVNTFPIADGTFPIADGRYCQHHDDDPSHDCYKPFHDYNCKEHE